MVIERRPNNPKTIHDSEASRLYRERFPNRNVPNRKTFQRSGGPGRAMTVRTVELEENVLAMVEEDPGSSTRKIVNTCYQPKKTEEFELQPPLNSERLGVNEVIDLLQAKYAIISGGKSNEGCPIITFPDNNNFEMLSDDEYQRLMLYLTSVPSLHDADLGFHLIIDRRSDRWNSVKTVLLKISVYFPGLIHVVYVLRPASFLHKALSEVSNKFIKDEFKFRMIVLSTTEELHKYINVQELTTDLDGTLNYDHEKWIQQRIELEKFSAITQQVSKDLDVFTRSIEETELPNDADSTQLLLDKHTLLYSNLKKDILCAAKHGEDLLISIKQSAKPINQDNYFPENNIFVVERLLVQLEETEKTFGSFWQYHSNNFKNCIELRRFEQEFRELQVNFENNFKKVTEMVTSAETVDNIDIIIRQAKIFQKMCQADVERADEVISSGRHLLNVSSCPMECIEPKCTELERVKNILMEQLDDKMLQLTSSRMVLEHIEKGKTFYDQSVETLESQNLDPLLMSLDLIKKYMEEIKTIQCSIKEYKIYFDTSLHESVSSEQKAVIGQVMDKLDEILVNCNKKICQLNKLANKYKSQNISDQNVPKQPQIGAPVPVTHRSLLKKAYTIPKLTSALNHNEEVTEFIQKEKEKSPEIYEINKIKCGHVLTELLSTEKAYVTELFSIVQGYKHEAKNEDMQHLLPTGAEEKFDVIFGNLDDIHRFHRDIFLKDLENCISSTELVALCFLQKKDTFFQLYSFYCQNISKSEQLRESSIELNQFFYVCQMKLGQKLPLAAYLLKPVQRITKYQLLLKDLLRYSNEAECCKVLQQALDCMLVVLKCLNDSMHQISITGFPADISQQGDLLLQGSFSVWFESKKVRLRIKPTRRHLFLYEKALLFCKSISKQTHNKANYQFKHFLRMSQIGLTESVKGDARRFEVWLEGRTEVHIIQAATSEQKQIWLNEIKKVLLNQLEEIKGEKLKQYAQSVAMIHKPLRQTTSWEKQNNSVSPTPMIDQRALSCDVEQSYHHSVDDESNETVESGNWSSDYSNSDDEDPIGTPSSRYVALADYCAVGNSEVNMKEGDIVELLKVGCAGWWFVKMIGSSLEGWAPAAYLEYLHYKSSRSNSSRSQDKLNF